MILSRHDAGHAGAAPGVPHKASPTPNPLSCSFSAVEETVLTGQGLRSPPPWPRTRMGVLSPQNCFWGNAVEADVAEQRRPRTACPSQGRSPLHVTRRHSPLPAHAGNTRHSASDGPREHAASWQRGAMARIFPETRGSQHPGWRRRAGGVGGLQNSQRKRLFLDTLETEVCVWRECRHGPNAHRGR